MNGKGDIRSLDYGRQKEEKEEQKEEGKEGKEKKEGGAGYMSSALVEKGLYDDVQYHVGIVALHD